MISENLKLVCQNIKDACERVGRDPSEVKLIAVSKTKPEEDIIKAYESGERDFGENYVQELTEKIEDLPKDINWHMIGHLQRNKVKYIVGKVALIHSVDTVSLAEEISKRSESLGIVTDVLVEVNIAGEQTKFGLAPEDTEEFIRSISRLKGICVKGLMTSAPIVTSAEGNRKYFKEMKRLCVDIAKKKIDNTDVCDLSMGMTGDYTVAVEEGATMVRVGTGIFGDRIVLT